MAYIRKRKPSGQRSPRLITTSSSASDDATGESAGTPSLGQEPVFNDEWLWFSDLCCGEVASEEVAAAEPYICFYERFQ